MLLAIQSASDIESFGSNRQAMDGAEAILTAAGRFAADRIAPLNPVGDRNPAKLIGGKVVTPPDWKETYRDWCADGWNCLSGPAYYGGPGLPFLMAAACTEIWNSAAMAFALCPLLTSGAVEAIAAHAAENLKSAYLPKMISGEWSGTMNLTEPQSGSDLSQLRCKAERCGDGAYLIKGNKIFITYGEHDCTSNIIHLVLARLDDAPTGTKGISLFLVPKILPDGSHNDLRCHSLEHKLGIHGSPTCAMVYGDQGGAKGWLIGEENRGLACMFTMMNNARVLVAVQGVALAERAMQAALQFARERKQGRISGSSETASAIVHHPDIKRLLLDMRAKTSAARMLSMVTAAAIDASTHGASESARKQATARAAFLTPLAKLYATDIALEVTSNAIQVHGGMGFIEETGVAQYYRDARILPIYEGTNGIQAIDFVTRKLGIEEGSVAEDAIQSASNSLAVYAGEELAQKLAAQVREVSDRLLTRTNSDESLAAATPFTRAFAALVAAGYLAHAAVAARDSAIQGEADAEARYFIATELPTAIEAAKAAAKGADIVCRTDFS
jgi:butyryl-CoA dehydrogenase